MATKKDEKKVVKKTTSKKTPVKASKASNKKIEKKAVVKKEVKKVVKKVTKTTAKSPIIASKGKQRKIRIEDKFAGTQYHLGVGKRKTAIALVRMHEKGKGEIFVNNHKFEDYFFGNLIENALQPLQLTGKETEFNISIKVMGGGVSSQAEAIRHGIARALVLFDSELRGVLKKAGLLTRDARVKERKKPGLKRARRAPQWKKR